MTNSHRNLRPLPSPELAAVEVVEPGTASMTDDQYTSAVKALAVMINKWRASQSTDGANLPWAA